ncbi:FecR family protein [Aurantiacibacter suaedae]|uniref:FecR family protein n=1 Tax=Aurantiacibacter suaedae TaxID=2545755 RepID=UPI0010F99EBE|nr:FecR domain-containing protein [Aurantiacibacter suaedae]
MQHDDPIREQAALWAVRTGDPGFADWDAFTDWLERDPAHAEAYDRIAGAVADAADAERDVIVPANDEVPSARPVPRRWMSAAVAAVLLVVVGIGLWWGDHGVQTYETAPGETRLIALQDGSKIDLAADSRIALDPDKPRLATLEKGRALFTILHDDGDPFVLDVGADQVVDAGTVFEVQLGSNELAVGVSEGLVIFNPAGQNVRIEPGQLLESPLGSNDVTMRDIALEQVGEWREGRITFERASIAELAAELSSMSGVTFSAAPASVRDEVSGSVLIDPIRADPASLGPLLGVSVRQAGDGWLIEAR